MLATDGCAFNSSNPACCFCAVWALGGPRGVAVAMFGPTGLGMLICRCEHTFWAHDVRLDVPVRLVSMPQSSLKEPHVLVTHRY
jgi:hypothetical protein